MKKKIRVGVIGTGRIGRLHTEHLAFRIPEASVVAVSDVVRAAAEKCAADFNVPSVAADYRTLLDNPGIDAIVICSSTDTHAQMIAEAAGRGKHVFCEKPISHDLAAIDRALEAVRRAGIKLQIGFNRRFDSNYRRVWELIREGRLGDPHILRITSRDPAPPPIDYVRVSGGIFLDMMIHDFDMARYLIGSEVEEVYTMAAVRIDPAIGRAGDFDTAVVALKFENGVLGTIDNSRKAVFGYDQRVEVFGSKGMAQTANNTPNTARFSGADAVSEDLPLNFFMERYIDSYVREMREFIRCVSEDLQPPVTGLDGRMPVLIGKAARLSHDQHRPVKVSEIK
ncbi:MAG: inositol 2-dehydrogenase [Opitutaceae bacterium]|jgi:myo-inositol 2-dehydrogenase/D-chiro-inositol 1-dehydrogenase